jgi:hypothetical protein
MVRTHYCEMHIPDAHKPILRGYNVWAWMGHVLLGQVAGSHVYVKTKAQAQKTARKLREYYNEGKAFSIPDTWILYDEEVTT